MRLRSIDIKNFRCIDTLHLDFHDRDDGGAPAMVLAGENGVGKTAVLEAILVGLGRNERLRGPLVRLGCDDFEVSAVLDPEPVPSLPPQGKWQWQTNTDTSAAVLLPASVRSRVIYLRSNRSSDLAGEWLTPFWRDEPEATKVTNFLRSFGGDKVLAMMADRLSTHTALAMMADRLSTHTAFCEIEGLGAGAQELLALACEIAWSKPAICLIDNPELRLSIPWQRRLIPALREFSPDTQFIMATHSRDVLASVHSFERTELKSE